MHSHYANIDKLTRGLYSPGHGAMITYVAGVLRHWSVNCGKELLKTLLEYLLENNKNNFSKQNALE